MRILFGMLIVVAVASNVSAATNSSVWAFQGPGGRMIRQPDTLGNRVLDYSGVGYKGGTVPIPVVAEKLQHHQAAQLTGIPAACSGGSTTWTSPYCTMAGGSKS